MFFYKGKFKHRCKFSRTKINKKIKTLNNLKDDKSIPLELKESSYIQFKKKLDPNNIDINTICTYSIPNEFNTWRESKPIKESGV